MVNELGRQGNTIFLPCRGDDMEWRHLKLMGDLGKIHVHYFDPKVKESVAEAMQHSDVVVNCIGKRYETKFLLPFLKRYLRTMVRNNARFLFILGFGLDLIELDLSLFG